MKICFKILPLLAMLLMYINASCQTIVNSDLEKKLFKARVKNIDEFMERFNGERFIETIDPTKPDSRKLNIISLFNVEGLEGNQEAYRKMESFADKALASGAKLNYKDSLWFAVAPCHGKYKGKDVDFVVWLNVEHRRGDMYKWVISKVNGEIFKLTPTNTSESLMISPVEHDINFMQLGRITQDNNNLILNYKQKQFDIDETSVFYTMVNHGLLTIEYVSDLQFVFMQVPDYQIVIKEYDRLTANSGWLIKEVIPTTNKDKQEYLDFVYNCPKCNENNNVAQPEYIAPVNNNTDSSAISAPVNVQPENSDTTKDKNKKKSKNN